MTTSTLLTNLKKFNGNQGDEASAFRQGAEEAMKNTLSTGDDCHWTELEFRKDGNGNHSWYIDLHSCPQGDPRAYGGDVEAEPNKADTGFTPWRYCEACKEQQPHDVNPTYDQCRECGKKRRTA